MPPIGGASAEFRVPAFAKRICVVPISDPTKFFVPEVTLELSSGNGAGARTLGVVNGNQMALGQFLPVVGEGRIVQLFNARATLDVECTAFVVKSVFG